MELSEPPVPSRLRAGARRPGRAVLTVVTVGVVLAGGVAVAAPASTDAVITGCYDGTNGQLRVVDAATACRRSENRITWNERGPAGEAGPAGPQGPAGGAVASFDALEGLTCRAGDPLEGVIDVTYGPNGSASMTCLPTALDDLTVRVAGTSPGFVGSSPGGIACGSDCTESYRRGSTVQLTAAPGVGSYFLGWSGACSGYAPTCTVTMNAAQSVTATFVPRATFEVEVRNPLSSPLTTFGTNVVRGPFSFTCAQTAYGSTVCTLSVPVAGAVSLQAEADRAHGDEFVDWSAPCTGAGPFCTFVPHAGPNPRITATFRG
jgi:hypothetical protein